MVKDVFLLSKCLKYMDFSELYLMFYSEFFLMMCLCWGLYIWIVILFVLVS